MSQRKNIILVSNGFYPENSPRSFRATELVKEFCRQGHSVTVYSHFRDFNYSIFLEEYPVVLKMWGNKHSLQISKLFEHNSFFFGRVLVRLASIFFEYPAIIDMLKIKKILHHEEGYDLIISFAIPYPVHWGVALARSSKHYIANTWIADCGDPYMFARLDRFKKPFYLQYFEKYFCKKCDFISVPFLEMKSQFYPEFYPKIIIIPQGFNLREIKLFEGPVINYRPTFIYAGAVIPGKRDLSLLLNFLSTIDIDFVFIIYTKQKQLFSNYAQLLGSKLVIRDYIERLSLIYEMSKVDFLINVDTIYDNDGNTEAVPTKLIDYALSKRPILNLSSSALDQAKIIEFLKGDYARQRLVDLSIYDIKRVADLFISYA